MWLGERVLPNAGEPLVMAERMAAGRLEILGNSFPRRSRNLYS